MQYINFDISLLPLRLITTPTRDWGLGKPLSAMTVPPGFKVTLFAGEPDVVQPIAMAIDDRRRL